MDVELFWKKIKQLLTENGRNQEWLCSQSGILLQTMRNQIHSGRYPSLEDTMRMVKAFGMTWDEFEAYPEFSAKGDVPTIPVYEQAFSAGKGQFVPDSAEIKEYVAVPSELRHCADRVVAAYVRGDSMEPTLYDGDIIICDNSGYTGQDGIYTIIYKGAGFVKRLQRTLSGVKIISDNTRYAPMEEPDESDDFNVLGRVRYIIHRI